MSTTAATSTGTSEASSGSNSDSETGTSDGGSASEGQTNTTDLSGSNSDSQGGSSTSDGSTGDDSLSGGGSSTSTGTSTGDVVPCGDYQDLETCEEDPSCQGVVATEFINNISAWCLGDPVFLGCIDGELKCAGDAQTVCVGETKHLLEGICLPEGVTACDPPVGGPNWKPC